MNANNVPWQIEGETHPWIVTPVRCTDCGAVIMCPGNDPEEEWDYCPICGRRKHDEKADILTNAMEWQNSELPRETIAGQGRGPMKLNLELDEKVVDLLESLTDDEEAPCVVCPRYDPRIGCVEHGDDCYVLKVKKSIEVARQKLPEENCLTCAHSFSEPSRFPGKSDTLHCVVKEGMVVNEDGFCKEYN